MAESRYNTVICLEGLKIVGVMIEIRTKHLSNKSLEHYR
jgi:hypothetical protein